MHGVNLDLLRATATHHPDGRPKDPHAHHRVELLAQRSAARSARHHHQLRRLLMLLRKIFAPTQMKARHRPASTCPQA
jgi:hypothetical protein